MTDEPAIETLADLVFHIRRRWGGRPRALSIRRRGRLESISTGEFLGAVHSLALALEQRGLTAGERVAIFSENCPEWHIVEFACQLLGAVSVPVYPTTPPQQIGFILRNSGCRWVFYRGAAKGDMLRGVRGLTAPPRLVVLEDDDPRATFALTALLGQGAARRDSVPLEHLRGRVGGDDLATIIYTSGTTGEPKGVMLSHANLVSNLLACSELFPLGPDDQTVSFLPLSHVFARTVDNLCLYAGVPIHYAPAIEGLPKLLRDIRPTVLAAVPRLFESVYIRILAAVGRESRFRRRLLARAVAVGNAHREARERGFVGPVLGFKRLLADWLVFRQIRSWFGARLRMAIVGGAPMNRNIAEFFLAVGLPVYEGYGLTETSPVVSTNRPGAHRPGSVGKPIARVEIKLAEDGEILVRGPGVMKGYWKNPEATAAALDGDWLLTGDVGHLDPDGYLFITDRKKDLLITSGGKNIAPQPIEKLLTASGLIVQAVVVGDNYPYLTALLVPDFDYFGAELGETDPVAIAQHPTTHKRIAEWVHEVNSQLATHERIRQWHLLNRELSVAEGEITPTLKVRRRVVLHRREHLIAAMYLDSQKPPQPGKLAPRTG